jgi:hypothetical protein
MERTSTETYGFRDIAALLENGCHRAPNIERAAMLLRVASELRDLATRYASECAECGGKGYYFEGEAITGRGPDDVFPEQVACPECADIRALIAKATP